jgi:hypothetical protein
MLQGTIADHRSAVATNYGPGVGWPEDRNTTHWLENRGTIPAVEISVDIVRRRVSSGPTRNTVGPDVEVMIADGTGARGAETWRFKVDDGKVVELGVYVPPYAAGVRGGLPRLTGAGEPGAPDCHPLTAVRM